MKRRPILRGRLSAGVAVQLVLLLCSVPMWAQSALPDITKGESGDLLGIGRPDFSTLKDDEKKPETRVLSGDHAPGDVHGVIRYPGGLPMAGAQVVILNADVDVERSTVSGANGTYVFQHLKPGHYQIGAKLDGFAPSRALTVDVVPGKDVSFDVSVGSRSAKALPASSSASAYRSYGEAYRAEPASLRLGSSEPAETASAEPTSKGEASAASNVVDSPKTAEAPASQPIPAAVADELAAMRKRIDELEAELKGRAAADQPAAAPAAIPAPAQDAAAAPAQAPPKPGPGQYLSTAGTVTNYYGDTDIATHPAGFDPFSYADWSWMNANGRNEDSPWSTKYFT